VRVLEKNAELDGGYYNGWTVVIRTNIIVMLKLVKNKYGSEG
jgi:hypothetical protein